MVASLGNKSPAFGFLPTAVQTLIDNGDATVEVVLTGATGAQVGLADGSATTTHTVNLLCGGEPQPGTYTVDMFDAYGDGWQTDDASGGSGMTVTLLNTAGEETVIEFGMCSPYDGGDGTFLGDSECTMWDAALGDPTAGNLHYTSATIDIEIPAGTIDAIWNFPGDNWSEISFDIYLPDGRLLYDSGDPGGQGAGELAVSYCN